MKKTAVIFVSFVFIIIFIVCCRFYPENKTNVLRFSSWGSVSETEILNEVILKFEQDNPDIKVEFIHIPQNYFQKIHLLFASSLEPDVVFLNNQYIQMYIKANLLEDLTPYFKDSGKVYFKEALDCFSSEGKIYAIPRDLSNLVIYYNKDIFKKKNIKTDTKIKDLEQLKNIALKLTDQNTYAINTEELPLYWLYFLSSQGVGAISDDKTKIIINNPKSIEILNFYKDLSYKYHVSPKKSEVGSVTTAQMFINSKLAMYISGRWMVPKFRKTLSFDWDVMEFPVSDNNKLYIDASGWAVSKKSKNKDLAVKFIKYLSSKEVSEKFAKSGLIIPARKDTAYSNYFLDNNKPYNNIAFLNSIEKSKPTPINVNYASISDILNDKALIILNGHNAEDVFDEKTIKKLESLL